MNRLFFRYLIWFFIAALPLQGLSASLRICCASSAAVGVGARQAPPGAVRHRPMGHGGYPHQSVPLANHAAPTAMAHCTAMAHADVAADRSAAAASHGGDDAGSCSACAACCCAAANMLPTSLALHPLLIDSAKIALTSLPLPTGYISNALERPPRAVPA